MENQLLGSNYKNFVAAKPDLGVTKQPVTPELRKGLLILLFELSFLEHNEVVIVSLF